MEEPLPPIMPHLTCSATTLNQLYPSVEAPSDEQLEDMLDDRADGVFQHGLKVAQKILVQNQAEGRKRRPEETTTTAPPTPTTATAIAAPSSSRPATSTTTARAATQNLIFVGASSGAFTARSAPGGMRVVNTFLSPFQTCQRDTCYCTLTEETLAAQAAHA